MTAEAEEVTTAAEQDSVLTKVGEFSDPDQSLQFLGIEDSYSYVIGTMENEGEEDQTTDGLQFTLEVYGEEEDQTITLYDYLGNQVVTCSGIQMLSNREDLLYFFNPGELCNECGLMRKDGTILIEQGPALIEQLNDRYLEVSYAEAVTEDENEAILYTKLWMSFSDKYYSGYAQIYDLEKEQFVPNIKFTAGHSVEACGDTLLVRTSEGSQIYDCDGNVRLDDASDVSIIGNFYSMSDGDNTVIYSSSMERLFTTDKAIVEGISDEALVYKDGDGDNNKGLMDIQGNLLTDPEYYNIFELSEGHLRVTVKDGSDYLYGVMRSDGTLLAETIYCKAPVETAFSGYEELTEKSDGYYFYSLLGPEGILADGLYHIDESSLIIEDPDNDGKYLCLADGTYSLELYYPEWLTKGLVSAQNADMTYGVYDLMTGEELTGEGYLNIQMAYGCLYCYKDGTYTVYEINR